MKKFLIIKVEKNHKERAIEWTPMPGLFTQAAAEHLIEEAMMNNPQETLLMQEVGAA